MERSLFDWKGELLVEKPQEKDQSYRKIIEIRSKITEKTTEKRSKVTEKITGVNQKLPKEPLE